MSYSTRYYAGPVTDPYADIIVDVVDNVNENKTAYEGKKGGGGGHTKTCTNTFGKDEEEEEGGEDDVYCDQYEIEVAKGLETIPLIFSKWDRNMDGMIDSQELEFGLLSFIEDKNLSITLEQCYNIMEEVDEDNNGKLDRREFDMFLIKFAKTAQISLTEVVNYFADEYDFKAIPEPLPYTKKYYTTDYNTTETFRNEYNDTMTWEDIRRFHLKRMFLCVVISGSIIGACVGAGVALKKKNSDSEDGRSYIDLEQKNGTTTTINVETRPGTDDFALKSPPSNLESLCFPSNIQANQDGYNQCLHACQPSQCCDLVDTNLFSCREDYKEECLTYHNSCQHLQDKKKQDAAVGKDTVDLVCSTSSLLTQNGVADCTNLCSDYMCCFPDRKSNKYEPCPMSQAFCADYGACSTLLYVDNDGFDSHQEAVATIAQICNTDGGDATVEGYQATTECTNACGPAKCCFVDPYDGNDIGCDVDCAHYAACSVVYGDYHPNHDPANNKGGDDGSGTDIGKVDNDDGSDGDGSGTDTYINTDTNPVTDTDTSFGDDDTNATTTTIDTGGKDDQTNLTGDETTITDVLANACSDHELQTLDGVRNCMDKCQHHFCCFDKNTATNCANEGVMRDECILYEPCRALVENDDEPVQSLSVEQVCTYQEIVGNNGTEACLHTCASHLCCTVDPLLRSSCLFVTVDGAQDMGCQEYDACKVLSPVSDDAVTLDSQLLKNLVKQHCTSDNLVKKDDNNEYPGLEYCHNLCEERSCCWEGNSAGSCSQTDSDYCEEVSACNILLQPEYVEYDFTDIDRAEDDDDPVYNNLMDDISVQLEKVCNPASISTKAGFHDCYDQCYYHLCCFMSYYSDEDTLSCAEDRPDECHEFSACSILIASDVLEAPKEVIDEKCQSDVVETTDGFHECHRQCAEHLCCFQDTDTDSSCFGLLGMAVCDEYQSCAFLTSTTDHPDPKNHEDPFLLTLIEGSCAVDKIETDEGREECSQHCSKRACCFYTGSDRCYDDNQDWCDEVVACEVLFGGPIDPVDDDDFTPTTNPLNEICNLASISTLDGFRSCYDACYDNICCFIDEYSDEVSLKCLEDRPTECAQHAACAILLTSDVGSTAPQTVDKRCTESQVETADGFHECHRVCAEHLCCFQDEENPSYCVGLLGQDQCDRYRSCAFLMSTPEHADPFSFERQDLDLVANVASACTVDNVATTDGHEECSSHCVKRACCFFTGKDNCKDDNPDWCSGVNACENLFHPDAAKPEDSKSNKSRGFTCESKKGLTEDELGDCVNTCESRRCCFNPSGAGGCYKENREWCNEYKTCEAVFGVLGGTDGSR